jgi:signal transduction histidine kinase
MASTARKPQCVRFCLREVVEEAIASLSAECKQQAIQVTIDVPADLAIDADHAMIRRAVDHLLLGALAAMPGGGSLVVTSATGRKTVELEIADTGAMLSEEGRHHAFDPFGTTERGASGWEMAMVRRIAELHGGRVTAVNCPDGGAAFTLSIPRRAALEAAA